LSKKLILISYLLIVSCSSETQSLNSKPIVNNQVNNPQIISNSNNNNSSSNTNNKPKFTEPVTQARVITPEIKTNSFQKVLRANNLSDYEFIQKEFEAGGLKVSAIRADNEFKDFPVTYTASSLINSIGLIGIDNRDMSNINSTERAYALDHVLKQIVIYNIRSNANKILEGHRMKLNQTDAYSTDLAKEMKLLFYGNQNNEIMPDSIAEIAYNIDNKNNLSTKIFDTVSNGISLMQYYAKNSLDGSRTAREYVDKGLIRMLYFGILSKLADAEIKNSNKNTNDAKKDLLSAEFYYLGIRNIIKTEGIKSNSYLETMLATKRFDVLDYAKFEEGMNLGISEKAKADMLKSVEKINSDFSLSKSLALSAKMYIDTISMEYKNSKYSRNKNKELEDISNNFVNAINSKNIKLANDNIQKLSNIFNLAQ
jgi:hypothetical protein